MKTYGEFSGEKHPSFWRGMRKGWHQFVEKIAHQPALVPVYCYDLPDMAVEIIGYKVSMEDLLAQKI
jgi:hypothetical protein